MSDCPFYEVHTVELERRTISGRQRQAPSVSKSPWCSHDESPVTLSDTQEFIGGGRLLKCRGIIANCQIDDEKLAEWAARED